LSRYGITRKTNGQKVKIARAVDSDRLTELRRDTSKKARE